MSFPYLDQEYKVCLGFPAFFLAKFHVFFQNGITSSWLYYAPALKFIVSRYLPWFSDSLCFISFTLTVPKHFYFKEYNLHCKPSLLPVLRNIVCISCRECFALIFLPVLMLLIWSVIIPYNNCFSSCVSALI